jgi:hypothetical protein
MTDPVYVPWLPGYPVEIPGQGVIAPRAYALIGASEAKASANWGDPKTKPDTPAPSDKKGA